MNTHLDSFFSLYAIKKIYLCTKEITMNDQTVICAIATAPGMGAIAVIRLSGKGCIEICDRIFVSPSYKKLVDVLPNTIHFGKIVNKEELIDEVLISVFHAPHSFTGEDSIEISCQLFFAQIHFVCFSKICCQNHVFHHVQRLLTVIF